MRLSSIDLVMHVLAVGLALPAAAGQAEPADDRIAYEVRLPSGEILGATRVELVDGMLHVRLRDGRLVAYRPDDVALSEVVEARVAAPEDPTGACRGTAALSAIARDRHLTGSSIEISGQRAAADSPPRAEASGADEFDEAHDRALVNLESAAMLYSGMAAEAVDDISRYLDVCTGSLVTMSSEEAPAGGRRGTGAGAHEKTSGWTHFAGVSGFSWQGWQVPEAQGELVSTIPNAETPYCRALAGDIAARAFDLRSVLLPMLKDARLAGALDMELDRILKDHGFGDAEFWLDG